MPQQPARHVLSLLAAAAALPGVASAQEIFRDDFNGGSLDTGKWQVMTHQVGRSLFGNTPVVSGGFARLKHDTYNAASPGTRFRGTEIKSIPTISRGIEGIEMESRVRVNSMANGLVTSFFTYNFRTQGGTGFWDEMDFEFLSSRMNSVASPTDPVLVSAYNDFNATTAPYGDGVTQASYEHVVNPLDLTQFNTFKMRWLPQRLEWYANGRLLRTVTGSLVPTDPTTLRFNFWAPGSEWPAAFSSALNPTSIPAQNVSAFYDLDWTVVRAARPAVTATSADRVFTDRFLNSNVGTSDSLAGFWTTRNQGSSTVTETAAMPLRLTAAGAGFPHAQIASGVRSEFNFFESPIEVEATGIDFSSSSNSYDKSYFRIVLSSQALTANTQSEFTSDDAFSLRIGSDNSVALGFKVNSPSVNSEFDRVNLVSQSVSGPVRRVRMIFHPTFYELNIEHDLSLTDSSPVTTQFAGSVALSLADWAILANTPTGDAAMYLQSQLSNSGAAETTTVALESLAVNAIRPTWSAAAGGEWTGSTNWSRSMVPNYSGANAIVGGGGAIGGQTISINSAVTVGRLTLDAALGYTLSGVGSLTVQTPARTARVSTVTGSHTIAVPVSVLSDAQFDIAGASSLRTAAISGNGKTLTKTGSGTLSAASIRGAGLSIDAGTVAVLPAPTNNSAATASNVTQLLIAGSPATPAARLDLGNNTLVIEYASASPAESVRQWLRAGRSGNGMGIVSSSADATTRIGYAEASSLVPGGGTWAGQPVDGTALVLAFALAGDANLSGGVDIDDFGGLAASFNQPGAWISGDFDYDGVVSIDDFGLLASNFNASLPAARAVPEPMAGMLALLLPATGRRRRTATGG